MTCIPIPRLNRRSDARREHQVGGLPTRTSHQVSRPMEGTTRVRPAVQAAPYPDLRPPIRSPHVESHGESVESPVSA